MIKSKKNILIIAIIIFLLLITIITGKSMSSVQHNVVDNIKRNKIIHIKVLPTAKKFYFKEGFINFYPDKRSVYGIEKNYGKFTFNKNIGNWIVIKDTSPIKIANEPKDMYYNIQYDSYLKIFKNQKSLNFFLNGNVINVSKQELRRKVPRFPDKNNSGNGYLRMSIYHLIPEKNRINSIQITLNNSGQPILVSASTQSSPYIYIPIYKLSYDNDIKAYNIGFNKMQKKMEKIDTTKVYQDD